MAVEAVLNGCFKLLINGSKKKKKVKVGTHSEEEFTCPTDKCTVVFLHFGNVCKPDDWENFGWWCDLCKIPRFWFKGTDLVRHKQVMHSMDEFPAMLSYCSKPAGFQDSELLEFSVKKFGLVWQRQQWRDEVAAYARGDK